MSKITIKHQPIAAPGDKLITVQSLAVGLAFTGTISVAHISGTFLRTYTGLVNLENPAHTWTVPQSLAVADYREVDLKIITTPVA